jgi:hypothetical protein
LIKEVNMRRVLSIALVYLAAATSNAFAQPRALGHDVRWDLVQIIQGTALAGGTDIGKDAATSDTVSLTGSGDAEPAEGNAGGGGTFVHRHANGTEVAHGVYVVTGFLNWEPAGGTLPVADGIGQAEEARAGILTLTVRLFPSTGGHQDAVLVVNCALPGATLPIEEGITLTVGNLHFEQNGGVTLFHVQK